MFKAGEKLGCDVLYLYFSKGFSLFYFVAIQDQTGLQPLMLAKAAPMPATITEPTNRYEH